MKKTVLITGASTGIGRATAIYFQEHGWNVIATMRTPEKEEELTKLENVWVAKLDVTEIDSITETITKGIEKFGKIDVLVNNAGYGAYGPLETFPRENIIKQFNTNVIGLLDVTKALLPHFRTNKEGVVINISSVGGKLTFPFGSLYHGTKFAVEGITESLVFELGQLGIKAKIVEPGTIATDFSGRSFDYQIDESIAEYKTMGDTLMKGIAALQSDSGRASHPSVVAEVIFKAATDNTAQVRYTAGNDADMFLSSRDGVNDEDYIAGVKQQFGF
ncbi:MAG: SDR family oxidoreductase [Bacteroidales bacterium]|nr:SDR family oxidoreductase [Bacteroidales bacterium]